MTPMILLTHILDRAEDMELIGERYRRVTCAMDLESALGNNAASIDALLNSKNADFVHDIAGIAAHMDRTTFPGTLTGCFEPRCVRPSTAGGKKGK